MASQLDDTVLEDLDDEEHDQTDDDDVEELVSADEDDDDVEDLNSSSPPSATSPGASSAPGTVTVALALPATNAVPLNAIPSSAVTPKKPAALDDARRLFQRLWTDEDEIELLRGFLEYTEQRGRATPSNSQHHDTSSFYDQIKSKLQLDFNKNQLAEKLRRLKKKYRNACDRINSGKDFSFRSPHDRETFEISRKIWSKPVEESIEEDVKPNVNAISNVQFEDKTSNSRKRSRSQFQPAVSLNGDMNDNSNSNGDGNIGKLIEETVKSCLSPLVKDLLNGAMGGANGLRGFGGLPMNQINQFPLGFGSGVLPLNFGEAVTDERWRKQQILELEVYSKHIELMQHQIKVALDELRSTGR